ncbi:MAG: xanthine dehydrogenase family protein subunit M [Chloroflexi bacterium]|nr:xanthine dehydrogenase family protein subunit M [Chloroflexota bacterium]
MVTFYRRLPKFDYLAPQSIEEALALLSRYQGSAKVIAGGSDVVPKLKRRAMKGIDYIVDLKGISGLDYISYDGAGLKLGPLATVRAVERSDVVLETFPMLAQAAESMASPQVRNRGTVVGNICNAVPSADMAPSLLTLDAKVSVVSEKGSRTVAIQDFFTGPTKTVLSADEIVTGIEIPNPPANSRGKYIKLTPRRAMDLAVVGVAVMVTPENGICKDLRIALGAVSPTPIRVAQAESILKGNKFSDELIDQVAEAAAEGCRPISDHRASAEYRRDMVRVLTRRAIRELLSDEAASAQGFGKGA